MRSTFTPNLVILDHFYSTYHGNKTWTDRQMAEGRTDRQHWPNLIYETGTPLMFPDGVFELDFIGKMRVHKNFPNQASRMSRWFCGRDHNWGPACNLLWYAEYEM